MKTRGMVLAVAFMLAATATLAVFMYVRGVREQAGGGGRTVSVIVAKEDLPAGTLLNDLISEGKLESKAVPDDQVVEGAITNITDLEGQETSFPILAGEQISTVRLRGSARQLPGGALGIPSGHVAITVPVDPAKIAGSSVKRGDHVIVFGHFPRDAENPTTSTTLVDDVQILKVDDTIVGGAGVDSILLTMALTPEEAQRVVFTQNKGVLWLGLLPPNEKGTHNAPTVVGKVIR